MHKRRPPEQSGIRLGPVVARRLKDNRGWLRVGHDFESCLAALNGARYPFSDRVGPIGRNTCPGDPSYPTDARVPRVFNVSERLKAEASVEVFNLSNRQNVNGMDTVYGTPAFLGPVPQKFGEGIGSPANSGIRQPKFRGSSAAGPARPAAEFLTRKVYFSGQCVSGS